MLELNFSNFPTLETARLDLREIHDADATSLHLMRSDENVMKHIGRPRSACENDSLELIHQIRSDQSNTTGITWGLCLKEQPQLIGTIGLYRLQKQHFRGEIGYMLGTEYWGHGLMSEAIQKVLRHSFSELGFHSIAANTDPANQNSRRILERNGFRLEGTFRQSYYFEGKFYDSTIYSILESDLAKDS